MMGGCRAGRNLSIGLGCLLLALQLGVAQKKPATGSTAGARSALVDKARALESRGRPDMAVQLWQQILLSEPNNREALAGLARDYKLMGSADKAGVALDRLRRANPNDPNIAKIEALSSTKAQSDQLRQAGELARQGRADEAMRIYRQLYGDHPPEGDIALAYYQTLFGTATGKAAAIAGIRSLADRNPGDDRFAVALGTMLTYDGKTRPEGVRILEAHPRNAEAQAALRQALIWDSANPASAAGLRQYLKAHPQDTEVAGNLRTNESRLARMNSGIARSPAERAAFAALNAHRLDDAQKRFDELLRKDPKNGRAAAGMGFLRMQQKNFPGAISYLNQAEQNGYKAKAVENALELSRFWYTMSEATQAMDENRLDVATAKFKAALVMNPRRPDALNGLAGLLTKEQQYPAAAGVYEQLIKAQPTNLDGWRGLFLAYARDNQNQKALAAVEHYPARVRLALERDPEYLRSLAIIYQADGRTADAQRVLVQALALPFPGNGSTLKTDTKLQYAGILMAAKRYDQAAALYTQILSDNRSNVSAWMGLIGAHHELGQDTQAIADVEKMPPPTYESALADSGFLSLLGAIYQHANQYEVAQGLIERAVRLQTASGGQPSVALQLQLAGIYLQRNNTAQAYEIYNRILKANPDRADAWKGLISTLLATSRNAEALQEIALIPAPVRKQLENDIEFEQAEAGIYAAAGDLPHAIEYMNRVQAHYAQLKTPPPANIDIQNAWLLYNTGNDRALYPALMRLGSRNDLTVAQRETLQNLWANWSVRRAAVAMENGNIRRSVDILDAAAQAFPDNVTVRKAVAGGFASVGRAKESVALYKNVPMEDAASGDFQGAIGAALAANDRSQAELWLRQALERFPHDPAILSLAARYEQVRGDNQRAAGYWRAALAAMPAASPTDKLAHELVYPEQDIRSHRAVTAADLQRLLDPDYEPFAKTAKLPPLPAYGADPYNGQAPVVPTRPQAYIQPPAGRDQAPSDSNPAVTNIPTSQPPSQQIFHRQSATQLEIGDSAASQYGSGALVVRDAVYHPAVVLSEPISSLWSASALMAQAQYPGTPIYISQNEREGTSVAQPVLIQQSWHSLAMPPMAVRAAHKKKHPRKPAATRSTHPLQPRSGVVNLPPSEQTVDTVESQAVTTPAPALRLSSQPMGPLAAQVRARFAAETDSQLTQGFAPVVRNMPVNPQPDLAAAPAAPRSAGTGQYTSAQYTPSAQEAATGAYSVPRKPSAETSPAASPAPSKPSAYASARRRSKSKQAAQRASQTQPAAQPAPSTLANAPALANAPEAPVPQAPGEAPSDQAQSPASPGGLSDQELQQRNLPPLRGPWVRIQRQPQPVSPREEAEMQLRSIESGYSGWLGGSGYINYRSGALGFDHLAALEAPFEASAPLGYNGRVTIIAKPVFLDSGQADGTATIQVLQSTTGGNRLITIPEPIGTLTATDVTPPAQQNAAGIAGELQLAFPHAAIAGGYTPVGFLVSTFTARGMFRPGNGPFTFNVSRDSVKDSQLSYAGLRDPAGSTLAHQGQIWGGVVANQGSVQFAHGDAMSGYYLGAGGQYITGYRVQNNTRIDGNGGAYWRLLTSPEYGNLSIGVNFFAMHYANNQNAFTHGMGGYFSPQGYFLGNVPLTFVGHYLTNWHYNIVGGLGVQAFQQDRTPLWPSATDKAVETAQNNPILPDLTSVGANYDLRGQVAYQVSPHWFAGGFFSANNTRNYTSASTGFFVRYMFRSQPSTATAPTGIFPTDGLRPFTVP